MNKLSAETSPYLLQHQNNPVDWYPWSEEAWAHARNSNKLVLVSVGYSSCHWCHVMEREIFEDHECAEYMNQHFICIKVDREERPDVDGVYMDAVHLMGSRGGWPLNVFCLSDGRPIYGGTYFPKIQWLNILENLVSLKQNDATRMEEYASRLLDGLQSLNQSQSHEDGPFPDRSYVHSMLERWSGSWDFVSGGAGKAPKFPMPETLNLLLSYGADGDDFRANEFLQITLKRMALGGIFDQILGGFARYSVDAEWKVPHFEKMLYDNAQLLVTYARAHRRDPSELYLSVVERTILWLQQEMRSPQGLYYAALDADSEGEEGKFYVWTEDEVAEVLEADFDFAKSYYHIGHKGYWEDGRNILLRDCSDKEFSDKKNLAIEELRETVDRINNKLLARRSMRIRPGLDDKCLTAWNALLIKGYCEAFSATSNSEYLLEAERLAETVFEILYRDGNLYRTYTKGQASIPAFLDDHVFLADACISLYESGCGEKWLNKSNMLAEVALEKFYDPDDGLLFFSQEDQPNVLVRRKEIQDNVVPSSNAVACSLFLRLSRHLQHARYRSVAERAVRRVLPQIDYAGGYSRWFQVFSECIRPETEVVITGEDATQAMHALQRKYYPGVLFAASTLHSELPLFQGRNSAILSIYVCTARTCHAPVHTILEAEKILEEIFREKK